MIAFIQQSNNQTVIMIAFIPLKNLKKCTSLPSQRPLLMQDQRSKEQEAQVIWPFLQLCFELHHIFVRSPTIDRSL